MYGFVWEEPRVTTGNLLSDSVTK